MADLRKSRVLWGAALVFGLVAAGFWLNARFTGPVRVQLETQLAAGLPLEVEMIPPAIDVQPGEIVNVIYRVRNAGAEDQAAVGRVELLPGSAIDQVRVYLTECGGLNSYAAGSTNDYYVTFRVEAAGLSGASTVTLRHVFERSGAAP